MVGAVSRTRETPPPTRTAGAFRVFPATWPYPRRRPRPTLDVMLKLVSIVIRVTDLPAQSTFWKAALDYVERDPADDDWVVLKPHDADAPCIALDAHHSERVLPPRIHLDIYAEDQSAEIQRLTQLGAREVHWDGRPADADYVIMEDPEGNRFCIVDRPDWPGWGGSR